MVGQKRALCNAAVTAAEAYGPNVSKGILAMEARIVELETTVKQLRKHFKKCKEQLENA